MTLKKPKTQLSRGLVSQRVLHFLRVGHRDAGQVGHVGGAPRQMRVRLGGLVVTRRDHTAVFRVLRRLRIKSALGVKPVP